jgi:ATP/maltotriose-dependent transcriptional regulator MalT
MADSDALRQRRSRAHQAGIHELCIPGRCKELGSSAAQQAAEVATARLAAAVEAEFSEEDALSRALALRLVELSGGRGPAAVQALRALGELVAYQRDGA